jgi:zinc transporter 1/2/3
VGLGVRSTYNSNSATANIVSGVLDSLSSGILIYTGLVEASDPLVSRNHDHLIRFQQLLAHEFLFNKEMLNGSNAKLTYALGCMLAGCAIMALLGKWA